MNEEMNNGTSVSVQESTDNGRVKVDIFSDIFNNFSTERPIVTLETVAIENIIVPPRVRKKGYGGLKSAVTHFGVLVPPIVMKTMSNKFILINGGRTLYAAGKQGYAEVTCIVYDYKDKKEAKKLVFILELLTNMHEGYTIEEVWDASQKLQSQMTNVNYEVIEYFLHLRPGEYTKLVDLMNCTDVEMLETIEQLKNGVLSIEQAYKKLEAYRKKLTKNDLLENMDNMEFNLSDDAYSDTVRALQNAADSYRKNTLDDETQHNLLSSFVNTVDNIGDLELDSLNRMGEIKKTEVQDTRSRREIDPAIRKARLARDENTCQCCGTGGEAHIYILDFHHVIPVMLGGKDSVDNGRTLCLNCHSLVHLYSTGDLSVPDKLTPEDELKFKKIFTLGNVIVDGLKQRGMTGKDYKKIENPHLVGRKYPGVLKSAHDKARAIDLTGISESVQKE